MTNDHWISGAIDPVIVALRNGEFERLAREKIAYLDYAGAALYAERQVVAQRERLSSSVFANPASCGAASKPTRTRIDRARQSVLHYLDADEATYAVIFTASCTAAANLLGETYPFTRFGALLLSADNHDAVNGLAGYARRVRAEVHTIGLDAELRLDRPLSHLRMRGRSGPRLVAFPAQSNFSGVQHPLSFVRDAQSAGFQVFLDAASFLPAGALSLREYPADFVAISFHKMFGLPTGLGALVARRDALERLNAPIAATHPGAAHAETLRFEQGTPNYLGIAALQDGFELLAEIGHDRLQRHVTAMTTLLLWKLTHALHANGSPRVRIHGPVTRVDRGGTVAFNLYDRNGTLLPAARVEERAANEGIVIADGTFSNPGAAKYAFAYADGEPTAALRASVGLATSAEDIDRLTAFLVGAAAGRT